MHDPVGIVTARVPQGFSIEEQGPRKGSNRHGGAVRGTAVRDDARDSEDVHPASRSRFRGKSTVISPNIRYGRIARRRISRTHESLDMGCRLSEIPLVLRLDLIGFAFGERRIGILDVLERVQWLLVDPASRYGSFEIPHYVRSHRSLVPDSASRVRHGEGIVR